MSGIQLIMNFEVTPTSHGLPDYRARGGYATLEKVLREMRPEEVTKEVAASLSGARFGLAQVAASG